MRSNRNLYAVESVCCNKLDKSKILRVGCMCVLCVSFVILFLCSSCNGKSNIESGIMQLQSQPIWLNPDSFCIVARNASIHHDSRCYKQIYYVDEFDCSKCYIEKILSTQETIKKLEQSSDGQLRFVYILAASPVVVTEIENIADSLSISCDLFVDTAKVFIRHNPHIPLEGILHSFLINNQDSVILVGDPLNYNKILRMMYGIVGFDTNIVIH